MIGNETEARFIHEWYRTQRSREDYRDNPGPQAPRRWKRLGSGCYRIAFLAPSGAVYKVQNSPTSCQSNVSEAATLRRYMFRKLPKGCRFPRYQLFMVKEDEGVMAMERMESLLRDYSQYKEEHRRVRVLKNDLVDALYDLWDLHDGNIGVAEDGAVVPIDLGG